MIFYKFSNLIKKLQQLRGKLKIFLKKGKCRKRHQILDILEIEARIKHLERVARSFGLQSEPIEEDGQTVYRVQSRSNPVDWYIVRPNAVNPKDRCECGDCHYRGLKCLHQIHVQRKYLSKLTLPKFSFKRKQKQLSVRKIEIDKNIFYKVIEDNGEGFTVRLKSNYWHCSCPEGSTECEHKKAVKQFLDQESAKLWAQIQMGQGKYREQLAAENLTRQEQNQRKWNKQLKALEPTLVDALKKAGIKVYLTERLDFLSVLTNKGWLGLFDNRIEIRTNQGQFIKFKTIEEAINILNNPTRQFIDLPLDKENTDTKYYEHERVQVWKMNAEHFANLLIVDTALNKIVYSFVGLIPKGAWSLVTEMKGWYEVYLSC